ncbi:hypothetical protein T4E_660 [Trichinella pseudospiralis]|uniref:Uncharacterized protein n=1 Tax=Trichinella pseudospiralis TaxID=6337 RepID=A0A0V0Y506_TRIPS|nr:hypothetical protein T4E_660 [Trichinella pseudospiralis]
MSTIKKEAEAEAEEEEEEEDADDDDDADHYSGLAATRHLPLKKYESKTEQKCDKALFARLSVCRLCH